MSQHTARHFSAILRLRTLWGTTTAFLLLILVIFSNAMVVRAAALTTPSTTPTATSTTGCSSGANGADGAEGCPKSSSVPSSSTTPTPNFLINAGDTGQYAHGKTSMSFCNGQVYVAWTGADDKIRVGWGSTGEGFAHIVTYTDTAYYSQSNSIYTSPALECWRPASGTYSDKTRLWIAFTGTNNVLYVGYVNGTTDNGHPINGHWVVSNQMGGYQTSNRSPVLAAGTGTVQSGTMRIGWVGINNQYLNIELSTTGNSWNSPNTWTAEQANAGLGMTVWCPSGICNVWIAWPGTDSGHHINIGRWNLSGGGFTRVSGVNGLADITCATCDLTLTSQGSTLRMPYCGSNDMINVDNSTNGSSWGNDQGFLGCIWGMGGAVGGNNNIWLTWPTWAETQIEIGIYQP